MHIHQVEDEREDKVTYKITKGNSILISIEEVDLIKVLFIYDIKNLTDAIINIFKNQVYIIV